MPQSPEMALVMLDAARYSMIERLKDGRAVAIRALKPEDRDEFLAAVGRSSAQSLYQRFFAVKRGFSKQEIDRFVNVDFANHVALVAVLAGETRTVIVGGGRYVVVRAGLAEVAFAVVDEYQGHGIGSLLMRHLVMIAHASGIDELTADVLATNLVMLKMFEKSGFPMSVTRDSSVVHVSLRIHDRPERLAKP